MSWNQEKMEELYQQMIQRATNDADFRRKLLDEPNKTLEELAGQPLPEGYKVNIIENDPAYTATCVLPDMISEELLPEELDQLHIDGGISFLLIISICGVAISLDIGPKMPIDICGANAGAAVGSLPCPAVHFHPCGVQVGKPCVGNVK